LFDRASPAPGAAPKRLHFAPTVWRNVAGLVVQWRW
jgi:hypothetical protein